MLVYRKYKAKQRDKRGNGQYAAVLDELADTLPFPDKALETVVVEIFNFDASSANRISFPIVLIIGL